MLVLTRREGESIVIGNDIVVSVLQYRGNQVQLGISAPSEIAVHRQEIYDQVTDENIKAADKQTQVSERLEQQHRKNINNQ